MHLLIGGSVSQCHNDGFRPNRDCIKVFACMGSRSFAFCCKSSDVLPLLENRLLVFEINWHDAVDVFPHGDAF